MTMPPFSALKNRNLLIALALTIVFHGGLLLSGTFKRTYDAWIHIFFADHYARAWFDHWEYRWYTGFTMTSYPPGSQQSIALISSFVGLEMGFMLVQLFAVLLTVVGAYRFSRIWVSEEAAGYAALIAVFASSIVETVHVFGQLPTTFSLAFLLNALPYVYSWLDEGKWRYLFVSWALGAATTAGHHVTTLFGSVFFVGPVIVLSLVEKFRRPLADEPTEHPDQVTRSNLGPLMIRRLRRIIPTTARAAIYGFGLIFLLLLVVFPYWFWSISDPIAQVPIPHASRDSFIENSAAGFVFWIVPYGVGLLALPYVFYKGYSTKAWPLAMSMTLLFVLGTGGTTPIPRTLLRGAYQILTLDRFTFWATIAMLPLLGEFVASLVSGRLARYLREQFGTFTWRGIQVLLVLAFLVFAVFVANLTQFRRFQPSPIDMQPIVTFLEKDEHWRWRYLALGFGDQMAWLSAQTTATTPDGNYHSARRLPELTTTPIERLEGAKFRGIPGIGSLQQFLAVPEKYNLKFVFSNDRFYDPLLFFSGWHELQRLENGIMVWEREDIPPLPEVLPRKEIPIYQRIMWGLLPMGAILSGFLATSVLLWGPWVQQLLEFLGVLPWLRRGAKPVIGIAQGWWIRWDNRLRNWSQLVTTADAPAERWQLWRNWARRLPRLEAAPPAARVVHSLLLVLVLSLVIGFIAYRFIRPLQGPIALVVAYYDDLDFRRFHDAYDRLDPEKRPSYEQYLLELSVQNGLVASYGKLDSVLPQILQEEPDRVTIATTVKFVTALAAYVTTDEIELRRHDGVWYLTPNPVDITIPPDQFFHQPQVSYHSQGKRRVTTETTAFGDVLDRPDLEILSARLVRRHLADCSLIDEHTGDEVDGTCERYSVVGELINTDVDPGDVTVTAHLFDDTGALLTQYNAQQVMMHKLRPKEVTPFRVDFEGVAGAVLSDLESAGDFRPDAFSPFVLQAPIAAFDVYAKAVVTGRDLERDIAAQDLALNQAEDGTWLLTGTLRNIGTREATIPHLLMTYYDDSGRVQWVDHAYIEKAVRPQRTLSFSVPLSTASDIQPTLDGGNRYSNSLHAEVGYLSKWEEKIGLPPEIGFDTLRLSVQQFSGGVQ